MRPCTMLVAAGASGLLWVACVQPASAATIANAQDGALFQKVQSQVGPNGTPVTGMAANSWSSGAPEDLAASATATALGGADRVTTTGKMTAHWDSADQGTVGVVDHGWNISATDPGINLIAPLLYTGAEGDFDWSYTFVATQASTFDLAFDLLGTGDLFGLGSWDLLFFDGAAAAETTELTRGFSLNTHLTGGFTHQLLANHQYRVAVRNIEGFSTSGVTTTDPEIIGKETGRFDWRITAADSGAVPEPASWALMIAGFGLAGAALRRRRHGAIGGNRRLAAPGIHLPPQA